jgi:hypothetical protein
VNHLVLSGTRTLVPSGTRSSCDRGPESTTTRCGTTLSRSRNSPNQESFGFLLTDPQSTSLQSSWLSSEPTTCANLRTTAAELRLASWKWIFAVLDLQEPCLVFRRAWRSDAAVSAKRSGFVALVDCLSRLLVLYFRSPRLSTAPAVLRYGIST